MLVRKEQPIEERALAFADRHWRLIVLLVWLGFCAWFIFNNLDSIRFFRLGDTDDNMRMMQVRGLLHGQGWYDLRQYRLNPPNGANIHWSRLVDLPIAGLILALRPFLGGPAAERWAVGIAPLLPYLLLLFSLALTARRLIDPRAYPLAFLALFFAASTNGMFMPERIDHHGWQLALLALSISSIADPKRVRGGLVLGISTALSLAIGLEMIIYLAAAGVATVLFWVVDPAEKARLRAYALSLSATIAPLLKTLIVSRRPVRERYLLIVQPQVHSQLPSMMCQMRKSIGNHDVPRRFVDHLPAHQKLPVRCQEKFVSRRLERLSAVGDRLVEHL